jgi:membrane-associated phospholipid phosphatase
MIISPTPLDTWLARVLAEVVSAHKQFALAVESGIRHTVFGGLWFGAVLFILWIRSERDGRAEYRRRILTILAGSVAAGALALAAGYLISWPPPIRDHDLVRLFPSAMQSNPNTNCFPSVSTAAYGSIAAGVYSLHKTTGWGLWVLVAIFIALPRMFVGGHYLTDAMVGAGLGLLGYAAAKYLLEAKVISKLDFFADRQPLAQLALRLLMFVWIVQVTVEFREVTWAKVVFEYFFR